MMMLIEPIMNVGTHPSTKNFLNEGERKQLEELRKQKDEFLQKKKSLEEEGYKAAANYWDNEIWHLNRQINRILKVHD